MNLVRKIANNYRLPYYTISPTYSVCKDHGYLTGEVKECPHCNKKTEVYSRITGYYRPVQNWNDGKTEEFKNRKTYVIASEGGTKHINQRVEEEETIYSVDRITIFTTKTCPNCKMSKMLLDKAGIAYDVVDCEEDKEIARKFKITKVPTLFVPTEDGVKVFTNASEIKGYIEENK